MCGVERVEHVGHGHRVGSDLQVVGLIEDALVLHGDVGGARAGQERRRVGRHDLVVSALDHGVADAGRGVAARVELGQEGRTGLLLGARLAPAAENRIDHPGQTERLRQGGQSVQGGAVVRRGQADQGGHLGRAAEELQVVPRHHPALGMAGDIHLGRTGRREHLGDKGSKLPG
jgi:hypothetical protein